MELNLRNNYFVLVKFIGILSLVFLGVTTAKYTVMMTSICFLLGALFLLCSVTFEIMDTRKKYLWLINEGILAFLSVFLFPVVGLYFLTIAFLDFIEDMSGYLYFACYGILIPAYYLKLIVLNYFLVVSFLILIYLQHQKIIGWYKRIVGENEQLESRLKSDMEQSNIAHRDELKQSRLQHENALLEEKARISQALHDKLGHSINGSLYKLEAVKVLIDKKPEESEKMLQDVIDNLRGSMDEIRVILRNEKPDKKRMAMKSLQALLDECEEQYNIKTSLKLEQEDREIPEKIWEIILDNSFEAVTNSLKYSGCTEIDIQIIVLAEVVRCTIKDNGKGAKVVEDGMGIQGMKHRVRNVKGYFDIEAENGFAINMILPI